VAISPAQARRERAALLRAIHRDLKSKDRAKLLALRDRIRAAVRARRAMIARARTTCSAKRELPTQRQAIAMVRDAKAAARLACDLDLKAARKLRDPIAIARAERAAEAKHQRDLRRIERGVRAKDKTRPGPRRAERRQESDDEVRGNLPPELAPLFEKVKRSIKGSDRRTRTEAFLEYAEAHPDELWQGLEARTDEVIAELERRQAMPNPKKRAKRARAKKTPKKAPPKKRARARARAPRRWWDRCLSSVAAKKYARDPAAVCSAAWWRRPPQERERIVRRLERGSTHERRTAVALAKAEAKRAGPPRKSNPGMSDAGAIAEYQRTHWGEKGRQRVTRSRAADPNRGTATELGRLVAVVYRTKKRGDGRKVDYEHEFSSRLPRLLYNEGGLVIAGGDYTVKKGGITG
jgi:hypothetical protein